MSARTVGRYYPWSAGAVRESMLPAEGVERVMMGRGYDYGYDMMGGYGWFSAFLVFLFGALFIAGMVLLIVWAIRASTHHSASGGTPTSPGAAGHDEAVAIAKRRLASGEITAEQYNEIIRALGG